MRAVMLDVPEALVEERRRLGIDGFDEMWEGELHMVPPPGSGHQRIEARLLVLLSPMAQDAGLEVLLETGLYDPEVPGHSSYRVPDLVVFRPETVSPRGIEGAAHLVVEIRSDGDESFEKLPYYERLGVAEVLIVDPSEHTVRHWSNGPGGLVESAPGADGTFSLSCLPLRIAVVDHRLQVTGATSSTDVALDP